MASYGSLELYIWLCGRSDLSVASRYIRSMPNFSTHNLAVSIGCLLDACPLRCTLHTHAHNDLRRYSGKVTPQSILGNANTERHPRPPEVLQPLHGSARMTPSRSYTRLVRFRTQIGVACRLHPRVVLHKICAYSICSRLSFADAVLQPETPLKQGLTKSQVFIRRSGADGIFTCIKISLTIPQVPI